MFGLPNNEITCTTCEILWSTALISSEKNKTFINSACVVEVVKKECSFEWMKNESIEIKNFLQDASTHVFLSLLDHKDVLQRTGRKENLQILRSTWKIPILWKKYLALHFYVKKKYFVCSPGREKKSCMDLIFQPLPPHETFSFLLPSYPPNSFFYLPPPPPPPPTSIIL